MQIQQMTFGLALGLLALQGSALAEGSSPQNKAGVDLSVRLESVAELPLRPGNVAATPEGRVFATVHPLDKPRGVQLIEITGPDRYKPWPGPELQTPVGQQAENTIDTPLGIARDDQGRLWITDMGLNLGRTRLWAFDIATGNLVHKIELPEATAPKGSFVQDLAVDAERGWVYLADINNPALIAVEIASGQVRRFGPYPAFEPEADAMMEIGGKPVFFNGAPAQVGVNPLTLSADGETLYFGPMSGRNWYAVPTRFLRDAAASPAELATAIRRVGPKPVSDGAATDHKGRHFFTNLNENGIDVLDREGTLQPLVRDVRLSWPDSVQFGAPGWLYISVNQLHLTPAFTGAEDRGQPPYRIMRVWTGAIKEDTQEHKGRP